MSYGVKYTCTNKTFTNQTETTYRIDILKDGYSGSSTQVLGVGEVFNLEYEKIDATKPLSTPLQNSRLEFNLLVRDASDQAILTEIFDNDERTFKMQLYQNGSLFWDGYVLNDLLEYGQGDYPQEGRIVAKDMTALKSFTYPLEDERRTVIHQIGVLLDPLNIGTGLKTVTSWSHDEMSSSNTFLAQTYLDTIAFREFRPFTDTGENDDRQITYYDALEQLARSFGLVIRQSFGEWHIVQISELRGSTSRVCTFNFAGSQATNAVQNITDSIDSETSYILPRSQNTFNPGLREARYTFNHRTQENDIVFPSLVGLADGDSNETPRTFSQNISSTSTEGNEVTGRGGITPKVRFRTSAEVTYQKILDGTTQQNDARVADVTISKNTFAMVEIKIETVTKTYYLDNNFDWVTDESRVILRGFDDDNPTIIRSTSGGRNAGVGYASRDWKIDFDIESEPLPTDADGTLSVNLYLSRMDAPTEFGIFGLQSDQETFYAGNEVYATTTRFRNIEFEVDKPAELANTESIGFNILNEGSNQSAVYEHGSVIFGDGPESFSPSALRYGVGDADFTSGGWESPGGSGSYSETLLREILFIQSSARRNLSAELYGEYKPHRVLFFESLRFFFLGGSLNGNNVWSADFLEIAYESATISIDTIKEGGGSAFSGASSGDLQTFREAVKANQFFNTIFLSNFIGELSTAIGAGSTITSFTANLSAQIRVGEDFVLVDKANERPFFVSVVADPDTGAEEYNTGENVVVHVEEQFIKNELPVGSPVILAGGLLESYFTIDPTKLLISVEEQAKSFNFGELQDVYTDELTSKTSLTISNPEVSSTNFIQFTDGQHLRIRRKDGESQVVRVDGNQTFTSAPYTVNVQSFNPAFTVIGLFAPLNNLRLRAVLEPTNIGSTVASIEIKADANEASITSLTSVVTANGLSGSTNITQRTSIVEGEVDTLNSEIVLKTDVEGNIAAISLDSTTNEGTIGIKADQITFVGSTTFIGDFFAQDLITGASGARLLTPEGGDSPLSLSTPANEDDESQECRLKFSTYSESADTIVGGFDLLANGDANVANSMTARIRKRSSLGTLNIVLDGNVTYTGTLSSSSDKRLKGNVVPLGSALEKIAQLDAVVYDTINPDDAPDEREIGLFAQDVEPLFPEAVGERTEENEQGEEITYKTLSYIQLIPALIESIKELKQEIDQLKNEQGI